MVPHQEQALLVVTQGIFVHKIVDCGFQNPFDTVCLVKVPAYVVIQFWKPGNKEFFMIDIETFIAEKQGSLRKSLTEGRAREIGTTCYLG